MRDRTLGQVMRRLCGVRLGRFEQHPPCALDAWQPAAPRVADAGLPGICCVTPSYNQGEYIARAVRSVLGQSYPALHYVVQDACSTDQTQQELQAFGSQLELHREADSGQADAINRGFARCSAELMCWLNADDILLRGAMHHVAQYFMQHPAVDVVYGDRLVLDVHDRVIGRWILPRHDARVLRRIDYVPQETLFWRRRAWERIGAQLDTSLDFAIDWDLLLRFDAAGCRVEHIPRLLGGFRVHAAQKTQLALKRNGRAEMRLLRERSAGGARPMAGSARHMLYLLRHIGADQAYRRSRV